MIHPSGACVRFRKGAMIHYAGDVLAFSPLLVIDDARIAGVFAIVADALKETE